MLLYTINNCLLYELAPVELNINAIVKYGTVSVKGREHEITSNVNYLGSLSTGISIHALGFSASNYRAWFGRVAGYKIKLLTQIPLYSQCIIKLTKTKNLRVSSLCIACQGQLKARNIALIYGGKAGRSRRKGRRPIVRGVAMNPIDHPHGGGQGKTSGGRVSVSP
jgi:large subunit ribosomal protein L2